MITLVQQQWATLEELCREIKPKRLDVLTGFIGMGASKALARLGVKARIVIGLPSERAGLSKAQVDELAELCQHHEVRWLPGLHAKMYLLEDRAVIVGSANLTRAGFEHLDELALATDETSVVADAVAAFTARFGEAHQLNPADLTILPAATGDTDGDTPEVGLGVAWTDRTSGFSAPVTPTSIGDVEPAFFVNVGDGPHRCWEDCRRYGFISAGQGRRFSEQLHRLHEGAIIFAYLTEYGYVGHGTVTGSPRMAKEHVVEGRRLFELQLQQPGIMSNADDPAKCEWLVPVTWHRTLDRIEATSSHLFRRGFVVCRLQDEDTRRQLAATFAR